MCGIAGSIRYDGAAVDAAALQRACDAMRHRGPDHAGYWIDAEGGGGVGLAAVRLAVRDPSPAAHQPMRDASGRFALVYNGEIYNAQALRDELKASGPFTTTGDTEVVLRACARWGVGALSRLSGMWALGFWDRAERRGFIARDRFGIKPLVYAPAGDGLCFASEVGALHALGGDRRVDTDAVTQLLQYGYIAAPATIYRGARRLLPGGVLEFGPDGVGAPGRFVVPASTHRGRGGATASYGKTTASSVEATASYGETTAALREALRAAVARRKVSDVALGAFLSGGLDSSIVVAHLSEAVGGGVRTFAVGHAEHAAYDETRFARLVARRFGTDHHELKLTARDIIEAIPSILDHLGEPVGDSSIIPTTLVSRFARRTVTVALSGDAGDELFGGYWRYVAHAAADAYRRVPRALRRRVIEPLMRRAAASKSSVWSDRVRQFRKLVRNIDADPMQRHLSWSRILAPEAQRVFASPERARRCDASMLRRARALAGPFADDPLAGILAFDLQYGLPADMLHKVDSAAMSHSLEVRVPFLDEDVVQLALGIPTSWKIDRGMRKRILIDAYRGVLPDEVLDRPKKGFEVPLGEYLRGPLYDLFRDTVTRDAVESFEGLSYDGVVHVLDEHRARRGEHADLLFALLSLCWWRGRTG